MRWTLGQLNSAVPATRAAGQSHADRIGPSVLNQDDAGVMPKRRCAILG